MFVLTCSDVFGRGRATYAMHEAGATDRKWSYPEHSHSGFCELMYVLSGEIEHRIQGTARRLHAGQVTVVRERDRHAISGRDFRYYNVNIPIATWHAVGEYLGPAYARRIERATRPPVGTVPTDERNLMEQRLGELFKAQRSTRGEPLLRRFLVDSAVRMLAPTSLQPLRQDGPAWLQELLSSIDDRHLATLDAVSLARLSGKSHEHLARTFRAQLATTPTRYLHRLRIERAALRLSHTNQPIVAIALGLGFDHLGYFYRLFRAHHGMPPQAYRRRHATAALAG